MTLRLICMMIYLVDSSPHSSVCLCVCLCMFFFFFFFVLFLANGLLIIKQSDNQMSNKIV